LKWRGVLNSRSLFKKYHIVFWPVTDPIDELLVLSLIFCLFFRDIETTLAIMDSSVLDITFMIIVNPIYFGAFLFFLLRNKAMAGYKL